MDIGPVLHLKMLPGGKVCALASRVEPRDCADTAAMLDRFSPADLISFARRLDQGLNAWDFADAGRQLDQISDRAFARHGLTPADITALRGRFTPWPRTAGAGDARPPSSEAGQEPEPGR